ncbi:MAG: hypothetical protein IT379_15180 [Deltaproteobacteria bacterium]|nr:hypothetical protein [Deltaproteobacteria bacterium]
MRNRQWIRSVVAAGVASLMAFAPVSGCSSDRSTGGATGVNQVDDFDAFASDDFLGSGGDVLAGAYDMDDLATSFWVASAAATLTPEQASAVDRATEAAFASLDPDSEISDAAFEAAIPDDLLPGYLDAVASFEAAIRDAMAERDATSSELESYQATEQQRGGRPVTPPRPSGGIPGAPTTPLPPGWYYDPVRGMYLPPTVAPRQPPPPVVPRPGIVRPVLRWVGVNLGRGLLWLGGTVGGVYIFKIMMNNGTTPQPVQLPGGNNVTVPPGWGLGQGSDGSHVLIPPGGAQLPQYGGPPDGSAPPVTPLPPPGPGGVIIIPPPPTTTPPATTTPPTTTTPPPSSTPTPTPAPTPAPTPPPPMPPR